MILKYIKMVGDISFKFLEFSVELLSKYIETRNSLESDESNSRDGEITANEKRVHLAKNFQKKPSLVKNIKVKKKSMANSQGVSDHSGSAYHGPGKINHDKVDSNMAQRNFENHQGN